MIAILAPAVLATSGCDIPVYQYSAAEKSARPSEEATDVVNKKAFLAWNSRLDVVNEALAFCGLPAATRSELRAAQNKIGGEVTRSDFLNRHLSFKCPEPGKDSQ